MKKLMMAVAIAAIGFSASAAEFKWGNASQDYVNSAGEGYDEGVGANVYAGAKMFLYLGTVSYSSESGFDFGTATLLTSAGFTGPEDYIYGNVSSYTADKSVNAGDSVAGQDFTLILIDGTTYASAADIKDGDEFVLRTGTSKADAYDTENSKYYAEFYDTAAIEQSSWQTYSSGTEPTPEPTSGLLLLLGMAGLALRRKHA